MTVTARGTWTLLLGAVLISSAPLFVKGLVLGGMAPTPIAFWRVAVGAVVLLGLAAARGVPLGLGRAAAIPVLASAVAFTIDLYVWHRSIVLVGAGMATILGNTQVFWMTAYGRLLHRERFPRAFKVAVPMAFLGVVLVTGVGSEVDFTGPYLAGVAFGVATAVAYSTYMICLRQAARQDSGSGRSSFDQTLVVLGWICALCAVLLLGVCLLEGERIGPETTAEVLGVIGAGVVPQVLGWIAITSGMRVLPASRAGLLLLLQPTLATVWGALLFGESLAPLQVVGAAVTLGAIYLGSVARGGPAPAPSPPGEGEVEPAGTTAGTRP